MGVVRQLLAMIAAATHLNSSAATSLLPGSASGGCQRRSRTLASFLSTGCSRLWGLPAQRIVWVRNRLGMLMLVWAIDQSLRCEIRGSRLGS